MASAPDGCFTAVAVCGCGHDGRLGLGPRISDSNVTTPTLIPDFLPGGDMADDASSSASSSSASVVVAVASGGYHTLVLTTGGLFGWGANDCGQLGIGRAVEAVPAPTRLTFFDPRVSFDASSAGSDAIKKKKAEGDSDRNNSGEERIVAVSCGGRHSAVLTTRAVYVCGANDGGQLGLGHGGGSEECVFTWTQLCTFSDGVHGDSTDSNGLPVTPPPPSSSSALSEFVLTLPGTGAIVSCRITHLSCGTNHTLLGLHNAVTIEHVDDTDTTNNSNSIGGVEVQRDCNGNVLRLWPAMVLAAGRGDYGELGYDGTLAEVEKERSLARQAAALREAQQRQQQQQGEAGSALYPYPLQQQQQQELSAATTADPLYRFKMKHRAVQRRPAFLSPAFRPVVFPTTTHNNGGGGAGDHGICLDSFPLDPSELGSSGGITATWAAAMSGRNSATATKDSSCCGVWHIESLDASHLHSAVTMAPGLIDPQQQCGGFDGGPVSSSPSSSSSVDGTSPHAVTVHWGCYYCNKVEGVESSIPRPVVAARGSDSNDEGGTEEMRWESRTARLHGGDEVCLWHGPGSVPTTTTTSVRVRGKGTLGLGDDDDFEERWQELPGTDSVVKITGRSHLLLLGKSRSTPSTTTTTTAVTAADGIPSSANGEEEEKREEEISVVLGFGDNLHGQLGSSSSSNSRDDNEEDVVVAPRVLIRSGDCIDGKWTVRRIRDIAAGARHSVYLLDVSPI